MSKNTLRLSKNSKHVFITLIFNMSYSIRITDKLYVPSEDWMKDISI